MDEGCTSIVGIGNELRGDDAIGGFIISLLEKDRDFADDGGIKLYNAGQDPFFIISIIEKSERVIIIDCAMMNRNPGDYEIMDYEGIKHNKDHLRSLHSFSVADAVSIGLELYPGRDIRFIGIQPKNTAVKLGISPELLSRTGKIIKCIKKLVREKRDE